MHEKNLFATLNLRPISPTFVYLIWTETVVEGFTLMLMDLPFSLPFLLLSLFLSLFQLCVQKLRILIEDSDQNCEPSVNACSVSFSHCLRVSDYGTVHPFRRH